ncbi:MAG: hypothetical protein JKY37_31775 [Nannocystaceae bacterium]|nr:hypothetical protein [Nannocystaceae bacterium]
MNRRPYFPLALALIAACGDDHSASQASDGTGSASDGSTGANSASESGPEADSTESGFESSTTADALCAEIYEGTLVLEGQAAVDAMGQLGEVTETLTISGEVTNLSALGCLRTVRGELRVTDTSGLQGLSGLSVLSELGSLRVTDNPDLVSLEGLDALRFVPRIALHGNGLTTLGLSQLQAANNLTIGECSVQAPRGEPLLTDLDGLESLLAIGNVSVYGTPRLTNVSGLRSFAERNGVLPSMLFWFNAALESELVIGLADELGAYSASTCGNLGEDPRRCACPFKG